MTSKQPNGKNQWELLRKAILNQFHEKPLRNITEKWVSFLKRDKRMPKNSFVVWNMGSRGSGKTAEVFKIINTILENNNKRIIQFWKATDAVIVSIEKVCPLEFKGRFENISRLRDIKANSILIIDEGLLGANAKEALKKEMRNFIKFLSKSRHYDIIIIINSISYNILLDFRSAVDILIYRRLPRMFIKQHMNKDAYLREYSEQIIRLKEWEGILISNYKRFENTGKISWKYENYCPWFNDNISMYQESTSPDIAFDENKKELDNNKEIVEWIIGQVSDKFIGKRGYANLRMWLYTNHQDKFFDNKSNLKTIYELYVYYYDSGLFVGRKLYRDLETDENKEYNEVMEKIENFVHTTDFSIIESNAIKLYINRHRGSETLDRNVKIFQERLTKTKDQLSKDYKLSTAQVYGVIRRMKGKYIPSVKKYAMGSINYYKGHLFEKVYGRFLKSLHVFDEVIIDGNAGRPDITAFKDDMVIVISCKNVNLSVSILNARGHAAEIKACKTEYRHIDKIYMVVVLYDNSSNNIYHLLYDYNSPINIDVKKSLKKLMSSR